MAVFCMVSGIGIVLVLVGFFALVYLIPKWTPKNHINTEFLSTRAALWCVAVGLILVVLAAIEVSVKDTLQHWPRPCSVTREENVDVSR
jgi:amino acid permease